MPQLTLLPSRVYLHTKIMNFNWYVKIRTWTCVKSLNFVQIQSKPCIVFLRCYRKQKNMEQLCIFAVTISVAQSRIAACKHNVALHDAFAWLIGFSHYKGDISDALCTSNHQNLKTFMMNREAREGRYFIAHTGMFKLIIFTWTNGPKC